MVWENRDGLELGGDEPGEGSFGPWGENGGEILEGDSLGRAEVLAEHGFLLAGEFGGEDVEVDLVVDEKGAIIEIAGADDGEASVGDEEFPVKHFGWVLVEEDSGLEEFPPVVLGGVSGCEGVDVVRGDEDLDFDSSFRGREEGFSEGAVGDEVGLFEDQGFLGSVDGVKDSVREGVLGIAGGVGDEAGAVWPCLSQGREVVGAGQAFTGEFLPILGEGFLNLGD